MLQCSAQNAASIANKTVLCLEFTQLMALHRQKYLVLVVLIICASTLYVLGGVDHARDHLKSGYFKLQQSGPGGFYKDKDVGGGFDLERVYPGLDMCMRYESPEVWRAENMFKERAGQPGPDRGREIPRPPQAPPSHFKTAAKYLEQTLVADYPSELINDVFLMLKTGGTVMWERLPIHLFTTLTRTKNFAIYSDFAGSIGGYEVIDILRDLPENVMNHEQLTSYRLMRKVHREGYRWDISDIDFHDRNDGWANDKFKNMPMLWDAYKRSPNSKWFVFMDDDTYIMWDNLVQYLSTLNHTERYYIGSPAGMMEVKHHGEKMSTFGHGGSGVAISKAAMDALFGPKAKEETKAMLDHWADTTLGSCCGDLMVSWILFEVANTTLLDNPGARFQGEPIATLHHEKDNMCQRVLSFHHITGHDTEILWEYERLARPGKPLLFNDFYRDFVLPFVVEEREDWYMSHHSYEIRADENMPFKDSDGVDIFPYATKEDCRAACEAHDVCYVWSFWEGNCELKHHAIILGKKANKDYRGYKEKFGNAPKVYTGWMVDRIRKLRAKIPCDPLQYNEETGQYNDSPETAEGWALRQQSWEDVEAIRNNP